jgi:hypothetical protein
VEISNSTLQIRRADAMERQGYASEAGGTEEGIHHNKLAGYVVVLLCIVGVHILTI